MADPLIVPPKEDNCLYLTNEQAARLAAITLDSLVGAQVRGDANADSYILVDTVQVDYEHDSTHYVIYSDGSFDNVT